MAFRYQAVDTAGKTLMDTIEANSSREAADQLRERGLFITRLEPVADGVKPSVSKKQKAGGKSSDVMFFMQQMSMLIRSGARVVQALEAIEEQSQRASWRMVLQSIRSEVEEGKALSDALSRFPKLFPAIVTNIVSAGEASGDMALAFDRLCTLTRQQQEIRSRVVGALTYPLVLMTLCFSVIIILVTFVLPRFAEMFETLDVELPPTTAILIAVSNGAREYWPYLLVAAAVAVGAAVWVLKSPQGKLLISRFSVRVPLFGALVRSIILARICRIWGQLIDSKVGVLEGVRLTKNSTTNRDFIELLDKIEEAIVDGNSIGPALKQSWLLPKTYAAAIVTGEESGKLGVALLFVATCMEEDNAQILASLARIIEPIMLVIMGIIVGTVAISLFLPMFDMATIAS